MGIVKATEGAIQTAGELLRAGRLVAFPTETVYGLGADATNGPAVAGIFEAKGRPRFNPLIVHVADRAQAAEHASFTPLAARLAEAFWPGPLTIVLKRQAKSAVCDLVSAGLDSVALRVPDHAIAQALLRASGRPLAAPSANRSGHVSPTLAKHVLADLGQRAALILDGGATLVGLESTIVDARGAEPVLLRSGAIAAEQIEAVCGHVIQRRTSSARPNAPGQLESHYAPHARVRLEATEVGPGEALLAFGGDVPATNGPTLNLSAGGNLIEAAANLFASLRALDETGAEAIAVMPIPQHGLGEAINDRLRRASAPRSRETDREGT
jgi:L-threonylcarbamoyladenylate synthase